MFPAAWLVTRELTERVGPWDERLSLDDDGEYFARLVAACDAIRFVPDARSYYRRANTGSLSRTISESAAASLLLSMRLCIDYLLSLEDSRRTRSAALRFLQTWIDRGNCFDPGRPELFAQLSSLAGELGGSVSPPRLSWKYRPVQALFGWPAVRWLRGTVSNARLRVRVELERLRPFRVERGMYANPEQRGSS